VQQAQLVVTLNSLLLLQVAAAVVGTLLRLLLLGKMAVLVVAAVTRPDHRLLVEQVVAVTYLSAARPKETMVGVG
jgi:hypothetical protein